MVGKEIPTGLLYVEMDCPREMEEEFHHWYNFDHLPERVGLPGFVRCQRYAALEGSPRWLASYELDSNAALETPEYLGCMGSGQTAWTKRVLSHVWSYRGVYEYASGSLSAVGSPEDKGAKGLLAVRYDGDLEGVSRFNSWHDEEFSPGLERLPGVLTVRRYRCVEPRAEHLVLYELDDPWLVQSPEFARLWADGWDARREAFTAFKRALYIRILPN